MFDKLDSFDIPYSDDQKLFQKLATFNFESSCMWEAIFCDTEATAWIGKHVPISVSLLSILIEQPIFLCNSNTRALVESFVYAPDGLAT